MSHFEIVDSWKRRITLHREGSGWFDRDVVLLLSEFRNLNLVLPDQIVLQVLLVSLERSYNTQPDSVHPRHAACCICELYNL